jgi:hypothetical protein
MKTQRTLIRSPLEWQRGTAPVPHPAIPVLAERGGKQLKTPRPDRSSMFFSYGQPCPLTR